MQEKSGRPWLRYWCKFLSRNFVFRGIDCSKDHIGIRSREGRLSEEKVMNSNAYRRIEETIGQLAQSQNRCSSQAYNSQTRWPLHSTYLDSEYCFRVCLASCQPWNFPRLYQKAPTMACYTWTGRPYEQEIGGPMNPWTFLERHNLQCSLCKARMRRKSGTPQFGPLTPKTHEICTGFFNSPRQTFGLPDTVAIKLEVCSSLL